LRCSIGLHLRIVQILFLRLDIMTKSFTCSDAGVNCNWIASSENDEDLLNKIEEHATTVHNFKEISPELYEKVKNAIR
jgi:predicted small metal-binding protein